MIAHEPKTSLGWLSQNPRFKFHSRWISFWITVGPWRRWEYSPQSQSISSTLQMVPSPYKNNPLSIKVPISKRLQHTHVFSPKMSYPLSNNPAWWGVGARDPTRLPFSFQIPSLVSPVSSQMVLEAKYPPCPDEEKPMFTELPGQNSLPRTLCSLEYGLPPSPSQPQLLDLATHLWAGGDERLNLPFKLVPLNRKPWEPLPPSSYTRSPQAHIQVESTGKRSHSALAPSRGGGRAVSHYPACQ